ARNWGHHTRGEWGARKDSTLVEGAIAKCPTERRGGPVDPKGCAAIRQESFEPLPRMGSVTLDDIAPGTYRAEMHYGKLPPISGQATVAPLQSKELYLTAQYLGAYGSVTRGGEPLGEKVQLKFQSGDGFA